MQLTTLLTTTLLAVQASGLSLALAGDGQQAPLLAPAAVADDPTPTPFPVPGDNPLLYCADPKDYLLQVDKVDLDPNPPAAGQKLAIRGTGTLSKKIEPGATVHLTVKYGVLQLINREVQLCDYAEEVDLKCPLDKGPLKISKDVDLPAQIPPGRYTVLADVKTKGGDSITCFSTTVVFERG